MRSEKQFELKRFVGGTEAIDWVSCAGFFPHEKRTKAFQEFYDQLPAPRDKEAVQRWLRTKIPVGMPAEEAQVFLLLSGFNSFESFPSHGGSPSTNRSVRQESAGEAKEIHFHAKEDLSGALMPYECRANVKYDQKGRVTEVTVEKAQRISKWTLLLLPLHP